MEVASHIVRDELLALFEARGDHTCDEVNQAVSMRLVLELEIEAVVHLSNVHTFLSCIMLDDKLLQEEEGTLVIYSLSDLNLSDPQMRCVCLLAIIALLIHDHELHHEALLK